MKRKRKNIKLVFNFSERALYTLIAILIVLIFGVGVYAVAGTTPNPGHAIADIQPCSDGEILKMSGGAWTCGNEVSETDPKVGTLTNNKWCKTDGSKVVCTTNAPVTSEKDPQVGDLAGGICADHRYFFTPEGDGDIDCDSSVKVETRASSGTSQFRVCISYFCSSWVNN